MELKWVTEIVVFKKKNETKAIDMTVLKNGNGNCYSKGNSKCDDVNLDTLNYACSLFMEKLHNMF